jgi:type IV pilus assembly protein PilE
MNHRRHSSGMTLIELMVVIVVVAILGTIAVSSYRGYLIRANRTEARMALLRIQSAQEKFFLQNHRYADDSELESHLGIPASTQSGYYSVAIDDYTSTTYTAVASAQAGQLEDTAACQTLTIDQSGTRTPAGNGCWK